MVRKNCTSEENARHEKKTRYNEGPVDQKKSGLKVDIFSPDF